MNSASSLPDPTPVTDLIEAFRRSKTMFAAAKLGIFDLLEGQALPPSAVAEKLGTHPDATARLLEACVSLQLLQMEGGFFRNTPAASTYVFSGSDRALIGYVLYSNDASFALWQHLEDAVREGTPRWQQTFGWPAPIFEHFFSTEDKLRTFIRAMHGFGVMTSPAVARAFDLTPFTHLVDLGGATGHLTVAACEAYEHLRGTVFDLERVVAIAREEVAKSSAKDRIDFVVGDFFADALPPADLYALGRILHDWSEPKIAVLLRRVYEALPSGGALLIAEKLLFDDKSGPVHGHMQSLNMLVCTEGKERSFPEYQALLSAAGFDQIEMQWTGEPVDAILARKR